MTVNNIVPLTTIATVLLCMVGIWTLGFFVGYFIGKERRE